MVRGERGGGPAPRRLSASNSDIRAAFTARRGSAADPAEPRPTFSSRRSVCVRLLRSTCPADVDERGGKASGLASVPGSYTCAQGKYTCALSSSVQMPDRTRPCDRRELSLPDAPASNPVFDSVPRQHCGRCPRRAVSEVQRCADATITVVASLFGFLCQTSGRNKSRENKSIDTSDKVQVERC